jgi:hypothetical protein
MPLTTPAPTLVVTLKDELQDARRELERRTRNLAALHLEHQVIAQWQVACQRAIVRRLEAALANEIRARHFAEARIEEAP